MRYAFDPNKAKANLEKHKVSFEQMESFRWDAAIVRADLRHDEVRLLATGPIGNRLHMVCFIVERRSVRLISVRKANRREAEKYESEA